MQCSFPVRRITDKRSGEYIVYPCGYCRACRRNKSREWSFRVFVESLSYSDTIFMRLSYDDEHLPISDKGCPTLVKSHLSDFMKRLRYYVGKCRFYACGEYGEETHRPHYHVILYGVSPDNPVFTAKYTYKGVTTATCKAWPFGEVTLADVTIKSCHYVAKYMQKRKTGPLAKEYFDKYGELPEFGLMSRRPGLGYDYLKKNETLIKRRGYLMLKGHKVPLSRYYIDKMYDKMSDEYEQFRADRLEQSAKRWKEFFANRSIGDKTKSEYLRSYFEQQEENLKRKEEM